MGGIAGAAHDMSSHDEYSLDEEDFVGGGQVTLGFVDVPLAEINPDEEPVTIEDTFIGGEPIWLHPELKPADRSLHCDNCKQKMALLLQAFAPLDGKDYDRVIYVFACKNLAQCSRKLGSVKAIRGVLKDPVRVAQIKQELQQQLDKDMEAKLKLEPKPFSNPFGGSNPLSGDANPFGSLNPFAARSNPFAKDTKQEPTKSEPLKQEEVATTKAAVNTVADDQYGGYPGFLVCTEPEKLKRIQNEPELEKYRHLIEEMDEPEELGSLKGRRDLTSSNHPVLDPQTLKILNMLDDKYFENFSNTVNHNPGQVLRYDLGGHPLLYNGKDEVARKFILASGTTLVPNPGYNPLSTRQFELQLMPKAIMDLEDVELKQVADILNGMLWGTIIVATDVEDFMPHFDDHHVGYIDEWCGVQWEELT